MLRPERRKSHLSSFTRSGPPPTRAPKLTQVQDHAFSDAPDRISSRPFPGDLPGTLLPRSANSDGDLSRDEGRFEEVAERSEAALESVLG